MRMNPQSPTVFHYHDFMELVFIENGHGIHFTENESYPIAAGDVFVIRERDAHGYSNTRDLRLINVLFYPDQLDLPFKELESLRGYHALFETHPAGKFYGLRSHLRLDLKQLALFENLTGSLEDELTKRENGFSFMAKALLMQIICALSRIYERRQTVTRRSMARITPAIAHLENNYARPIRQSELAAAAHASLSNLYRDFKSATGLSPKEYLIRLRVMRGAELLRRGESNVTETAFKTGFNDSNYFSRQFRRIMGTSPRKFVYSGG